MIDNKDDDEYHSWYLSYSIKLDFVVRFFYNIKAYNVYSPVLRTLRSHRRDSLEVSNTYLSITLYHKFTCSSMLLNTGQLALIATVTYLILFLDQVYLTPLSKDQDKIQAHSSSPTRSAQTIGETIVTTMILFIGMAGALLLSRSGKTINTKSRGGLLVAGFTIIGIALILGFRLVGIKT